MNPINPGLQVDGLQVQSVLYRTDDACYYRVVDTALGTAFELKEFIPRETIASRRDDGTIEPRADAETIFDEGKKAFRDMARRLRPLTHPALPRVIRLIEANGTLYQLREDRPGRTLAQTMAQGHVPDEETLRSALVSLSGALEQLHEAGLVHGHISPETVWLGEDGALFLRGITDSDLTSAASETDFAAPEQMGDEPVVSNGTDRDR
ncbi:MAG: hypothetical protein AAGH19_08200 [Pseudomonadota bacterium]